MNRLTLIALGSAFLTQVPAYAKPPGLPEPTSPQSRERTPIQRDFFEPDDASPPLGAGFPTHQQRRPATGAPAQSTTSETAENLLHWLTFPLGLAQHGMWVNK